MLNVLLVLCFTILFFRRFKHKFIVYYYKYTIQIFQ